MQDAENFLEEIEKGLSQTGAEHSAMQKDVAQETEEPSQASTEPDQLSKSARKKLRKKLKKKQESLPLPVSTGMSRETMVERDPSFDRNSADAIPAEPTNEEKVTRVIRCKLSLAYICLCDCELLLILYVSICHYVILFFIVAESFDRLITNNNI